MDNLLMIIEFPNELFFENNLKQVKKLKAWIKKQWKLCDQGKIDCEDVVDIIESKEKQYSDFFSIYSLVSLLEENIKRNENQQFDVTKIYVSENTYNKMKDFDLKIMNIIYNGVYKPHKIQSQVSMLHFVSGFAVKEGLEDNKIYILNDVLKEIK